MDETAQYRSFVEQTIDVGNATEATTKLEVLVAAALVEASKVAAAKEEFVDRVKDVLDKVPPDAHKSEMKAALQELRSLVTEDDEAAAGGAAAVGKRLTSSVAVWKTISWKPTSSYSEGHASLFQLPCGHFDAITAIDLINASGTATLKIGGEVVYVEEINGREASHTMTPWDPALPIGTIHFHRVQLEVSKGCEQLMIHGYRRIDGVGVSKVFRMAGKKWCTENW